MKRASTGMSEEENHKKKEEYDKGKEEEYGRSGGSLSRRWLWLQPRVESPLGRGVGLGRRRIGKPARPPRSSLQSSLVLPADHCYKPQPCHNFSSQI